ncbi:MAG TPA: hypothetical protein VFO10_18450 [Oligoflexus sp.]|uniref:Hint domain-containing protein n=1 Tax=Oligoflexus sp. TaxID=1971216 RepID=UPI002D80EDFB|nr:hypothetical protein [Oligoflexus sp.]HET9239247.1 hypothetical protein [Oligoflexus sp.]
MKRFAWLLFSIFNLCLASKSFAISENLWGYCKEGLAYHDEAFTNPKPAADRICRLPDAYALGETNEAAIRCGQLQLDECQIGAGGDPNSIGDHNVPRGAFFLQRNPDPSVTGGFGQMRCACGCFTPDVVLDTTTGPKSILGLFESSLTEPFRLITQAEMFVAEYTVSPWLKQSDFTVGPEENPIYRFSTDRGESITVTEKHPMVLNADGEYELRLAKEVKAGDIFIAKDGTDRVVTAIETYKMPKENNLVYNVNTNGERMLDHLVSANGLLVGDLYLQNLLSEHAQRVENIRYTE